MWFEFIPVEEITWLAMNPVDITRYNYESKLWEWNITRIITQSPRIKVLDYTN